MMQGLPNNPYMLPPGARMPGRQPPNLDMAQYGYGNQQSQDQGGPPNPYTQMGGEPGYGNTPNGRNLPGGQQRAAANGADNAYQQRFVDGMRGSPYGPAGRKQGLPNSPYMLQMGGEPDFAASVAGPYGPAGGPGIDGRGMGGGSADISGVNAAMGGPYTPQVNGGPPGWQGNRMPSGQGGGQQGGSNPQANGGTTGGQNWGYGNRAGGSTGYYEQQTPVGSFAAANQQYGSNPYIGQGTAPITGAASVAGGVQDNQYLNKNTGPASATGNAMYGMNNPYTTDAINAMSADTTRNYNLAIAPQRDAQAARSGSFGNTGVDQMRQEDQRNLGTTIADSATRMRMQDLTAQQNMGEGAANRGTNVSLANSGFQAGDLNRQTSGSYVGAGMGLDARKFDASSGQGTKQFNAGLDSHDLDRNTGEAGNMSRFNAGQGNSVNMYNAGAGNNMLENARNRNQRGDEFNQNMDYNVWQGNNANMRAGNRDTMDWVSGLLGANQGGVANANAQQQQPITDWKSFSSVAGQLGGLGGVTQQQFEANPWLGAYAGWLMANGGSKP